MPKTVIDFSKTIIYHFICKDETVKCEYVGSTTNFNKRKGQHKASCNNETSGHYHYKVYQAIRENGGWDNWDMIPLEEFPCDNKTQQVIREQYWIDKLKPDLNYIAAFHNKQAYPETHEEERKEYAKMYHQENKELICERSRLYHLEHREEILKKQKAYKEANRDKLNEAQNKKYHENKVKINEKRKAIREAKKAITLALS